MPISERLDGCRARPGPPVRWRQVRSPMCARSRWAGQLRTPMPPRAGRLAGLARFLRHYRGGCPARLRHAGGGQGPECLALSRRARRTRTAGPQPAVPVTARHPSQPGRMFMHHRASNERHPQLPPIGRFFPVAPAVSCWTIVHCWSRQGRIPRPPLRWAKRWPRRGQSWVCLSLCAQP